MCTFGLAESSYYVHPWLLYDYMSRFNSHAIQETSRSSRTQYLFIFTIRIFIKSKPKRGWVTYHTDHPSTHLLLRHTGFYCNHKKNSCTPSCLYRRSTWFRRLPTECSTTLILRIQRTSLFAVSWLFSLIPADFYRATITPRTIRAKAKAKVTVT